MIFAFVCSYKLLTIIMQLIRINDLLSQLYFYHISHKFQNNLAKGKYATLIIS